MNEIITNDTSSSINVDIDSVNIRKCQYNTRIVLSNNMSEIINTNNMKGHPITMIVVNTNIVKCQYIKRFIVPNNTKNKLIQMSQYIKRFSVPNNTKNKLIQMSQYITRFSVPNNTKNKLISNNDKKDQPKQRQCISEVPSVQGRCLT
jgi:hypothetical protein